MRTSAARILPEPARAERPMSRRIAVAWIAFLAAFLVVPALGLLVPVDAERFVAIERRTPAGCGVLVFPGFQEQVRQCLEDRLAFRFALLQGLSRIFYALGTSVKPSLGVLGRHGWLFLGDAYDLGFSKYRGLPAAAGWPLKDPDPIAAVAAAARARGLPFVVVVAPDKPRIYGDRLPRWAREGRAPTRVRQLATALGERGVEVVYLRKALRAARAGHEPRPVYYETDSHWNTAGAYAGYRAMVEALARQLPGVRALPPDEIDFEPAGFQGDIARFLQLSLPATELRPVARGGRAWRPVFVVGEQGRQAVDPMAHVEAPSSPVTFESPDAVNGGTLVFLRDSFGDAMAPFVHQTFGRTVDLHYEAVLGAGRMDVGRVLDGAAGGAVVLLMVERVV